MKKSTKDLLGAALFGILTGAIFFFAHYGIIKILSQNSKAPNRGLSFLCYNGLIVKRSKELCYILTDSNP